jgi:hypothetical protein
MSKLKKNHVLLGLGVTYAEDGNRPYYCLAARFRPSGLVAEESEDAALENLRRGLRDLNRAVESFILAADLDGPAWDDLRRSAQGPFALPDGQEYFGSIVFVPSRTASAERLSRHIRAGLNAAAALLRATGYYRVSLRYKPVEQLPLEAITDGVPAEKDDNGKEDDEELPV